MDTEEAATLTGREIHELHKGGGGPYSWAELEQQTGLSRGVLRGRAKTYRESIDWHSQQGQRYIDNSGEKWQQNGKNEARAEAAFDFPATLDDLLDALKVDTDIWEVERWGYSTKQNDWEGYAKVGTTKVINYENGVQTGYETDAHLDTIPLHGESCKIWATFRRIHPIAIFPTIQPVACKATYKRPPAPVTSGIVRTLIICDPHIGYRRRGRDGLLTPFQDRRVLDLALQIAIYAEVDRIDVLGDLLDMNDWSDKFTKEPEFRETTQPAIEEAHWWLRQFREARPGATISLKEGNHEERMRRAVLNHVPAAYGLRRADDESGYDALSVPNLLALDALGVEWCGGYPQDLEWLNFGFGLCHGDVARSMPGSTAKAMIDKMRATVVFGHSHTQELLSLDWGRPGGSITATGFCPGCTCHIDGRVPGSDPFNNWQQGLGIVDFEPGGATAAIMPVTVCDGETIWNGQLFDGRDRLDDLWRDLPDWNWGE
jgi:hypothetical protein